MKTKSVVAVLVWSLVPLWGETIRVRVTDDAGRPIVGAEGPRPFARLRAGGADDKTVVFKSNEQGSGQARGNADWATSVFVTKSGFHALRFDGVKARLDHDLTFVMRARKAPTPLYVVQFGGERVARFPKHGEWLGFDLAVADWVRPFGIGKVEDLRFRFQHVLRGIQEPFVQDLAGSMERNRRAYSARGEEWTEEKYQLEFGKWDAVFEVAFPNPNDGLIEETGRFLSYSAMKLPHEAPAGGYQPSLRFERKSYGPPVRRENIGFFLRTRTKVDDRGNIVSANYAKIQGDFEVDARGSLKFLYYFNPTANDRNLEFDTDRNLFPKDFPGTTTRLIGP